MTTNPTTETVPETETADTPSATDPAEYRRGRNGGALLWLMLTSGAVLLSILISPGATSYAQACPTAATAVINAVNSTGLATGDAKTLQAIGLPKPDPNMYVRTVGGMSCHIDYLSTNTPLDEEAATQALAAGGWVTVQTTPYLVATKIIGKDGWSVSYALNAADGKHQVTVRPAN